MDQIEDILDIGRPNIDEYSSKELQEFLLTPEEQIIDWSIIQTKLNPTNSGKFVTQISRPLFSEGATSQIIISSIGKIGIALYGFALHFETSFMRKNEIHPKELEAQFNPSKVVVYDSQTNKWTLPNQYGSIPVIRIGHTTVLLPDNTMWMFGGLTYDKKKGGFCSLNDVHTWDPNTGKWKLLSQTNSRRFLHPGKRFQSSAVLLKNCNKIVMYGGRSLTCVFDDLWIWKISNQCWSKIEYTFGIRSGPRYGYVYFKNLLFNNYKIMRLKRSFARKSLPKINETGIQWKFMERKG